MTPTNHRRLNVLLAAYACNPYRGSEEGVGWDWACLISKDHDVTVITAEFHRSDLEAEIKRRGLNIRVEHVPHRRWHYAPTPLWNFIEMSTLKPIMNFAYAQWQDDALQLAKILIQQRRYDLIHQATYVGYRFPGKLWQLGLPFVWGPLGGLENTPWQLLPAMGLRGSIFYGGRNLINSAQRHWLRSPSRAAHAAGPGLIAATGAIKRELKLLYGAESTVISEVAAPIHLGPLVPRRREPGMPLRLVWSGQHLPGKALNIALRGLARISPDVEWHLDILGGGPLSRQWQVLARTLQVDARCSWHGKLSRAEALNLMGDAHVLIISSLKDLTSTVLLEGLALGLPVVCPDHCGFSDVVTEDCGIKLSPRSIESLVLGFEAAVTRIARDELFRQRLSLGALRRARDFASEIKREQINNIYERVMCRS